MWKRAGIALLVTGLAYGVGFLSDAALNDDPCVLAGRETDRYDYVHRWLPVRTDCRVTTLAGASRIEAGSSEVFSAMFGLTLVAGLVLLSPLARPLRAAAILTAIAGAFVVIFIV